MRNSSKIILLILAMLPWKSAHADSRSSNASPGFDTGLVVAIVDGTPLTLGYLRSIVELQGMFKSSPAEDHKRRLALLDQLIYDRLVTAESRSVSLKGKNAILARLRREHTLVAAGLFVSEVVSQQLQLDSATVDTFYNNHIVRYTSPHDQRRARVITVWKEGKNPKKGSDATQDSLYAGWYPEDKIDSLYISLSEGADFTQLALLHSEDGTSRGRGGDLGWVSGQSFASGPFVDLVMTQPPYMIGKPIETEMAWHIFQVTAERPSGPVPLDDEIKADIVSNLVKQQQDKLLLEFGDSLLAVAKIDWNDEYTWLSHEELRNGMDLVVVNGRDTTFADEFLQDQERWLESGTREPPSPERRAEILRIEYVRYLGWLDFLREKGYTERPEVVREREYSLQLEREGLVRQRISSEPIAEPDSARILKYYEDSIHLFGASRTALQMAWNAIKSKLMNDARDAVERRWRKSAAIRHGVTRYDDRLSQLPFLELPTKKQ